MDRQLAVGNRVIANLMQQKQKKRLQQRIKSIKNNRSIYSQKGLLKNKMRQTSMFLEKNLQIQKQNINLFNRIASIIKQKPKVEINPASKQLSKSHELSFLLQKRIKSSIEEENKFLQKRLTLQKPTINNKFFYKDRAQNERYLKNMSKYPYILNKKVHTQISQNQTNTTNMHIGNDTNYESKDILPFLSVLKNNNSSEKLSQSPGSTIKQIYRHQSLDFKIIIKYDELTQFFIFQIQHLHAQNEKYSLSMIKQQFVQCFSQSGYQYQTMIGHLRVDNDGNMKFLKQQNDPNQQNQQNGSTKDCLVKIKQNSPVKLKQSSVKMYNKLNKPNSTHYSSSYTNCKSGLSNHKKAPIVQIPKQNRQIDNESKSQRKILAEPIKSHTMTQANFKISMKLKKLQNGPFQISDFGKSDHK